MPGTGAPSSQTTTTSLRKALATLVLLSAGYCVIGSLVTLLGWFVDSPRLADWDGDGIAMFPNAAICGILSGLSLAMAWLGLQIGPKVFGLARAMAAFVCLIAGLTLLEHAADIDLGIDTLIANRPWGQTAAAAPMRMGPPASLAFLLTGIGVFLATSSRVRAKQVATWLGVTIAGIALLSLVGYVFGAKPLYTLPKLTGIALQTATMLLLLGIGLVSLLPERGLIAAASRQDSGGQLIRQWLPLIVFMPLAIGALRAFGERAGLFDSAFGTAARTLLEIALLLVLLLWSARRLSNADSERNAQEQALRESEAKFSTLYDKTAFAVALSTYPDGRFADVNPAFEETFGFRKEEVIGKNSREIGLNPFTEERDQALSEIAARGSIQNVETKLVTKSGEVKTILTNVSVIDLEGRPYFLMTGQDITDRKRSEEALQESDRRKEEFLATLAHELRNPLAPIRSTLDYLSHGELDEPTRRNAYEVLGRQTDHLTRLVDDLLDISRISRGTFRIVKGPCDVRFALEEAANMVRPSMMEAGQTLEVDTGSVPAIVQGDAHRLVQVFSNLLFNAYKFTPDRGRISAAARVEEGEAVVQIQDTGRGMTPEELANAFDLFAQGSFVTAQRPVGLGVGLALAARVVQLHDGKLEAASAGPGQGTLLTVRLPLSKRQAATHVVETTSGQEARTKPMKVLIVDDNKDAADTMAALLRLDGHEVSVAYRGADAAELCELIHHEVAFLDLGMPEMDGFETARRLRDLIGNGPRRLVALTGWGQDADRERTREAGFDAHLVKPVDIKAVQKLLASYAEQAVR